MKKTQNVKKQPNLNDVLGIQNAIGVSYLFFKAGLIETNNPDEKEILINLVKSFDAFFTKYNPNQKKYLDEVLENVEGEA